MLKAGEVGKTHYRSDTISIAPKILSFHFSYYVFINRRDLQWGKY